MAQETPDLNALLVQAQKMQQDMLRVQEEAKSKIVEANAGGGMVTARMTGGMVLSSLKIDPKCVDPKDVGMLEDLVIAAVNQAVLKAQEMMQQEMRAIAGGLMDLGIPGL